MNSSLTPSKVLLVADRRRGLREDGPIAVRRFRLARTRVAGQAVSPIVAAKGT